MEKIMYPCKNMRITQGYEMGSHRCSYAIDEGEIDTGRSTAFAPFSGKVKKIYPQYENQVFFESDAPVQFADGTVDYCTILLAHQNSPMAYGMAVGKHYNQGEPFYVEGGRYEGKNDKIDSHIHMEFAQGKNISWYKNGADIYSLTHARKPEECCFVDNSYKIINDYGYNFVNLDNLLVYEAYCQDIGWQGEKHDGEVAGTVGQSRRLEAFRIRMDGDVYAKVHIAHIGWKDYGKVTWDTIIGTTEQSKGIECICLKGRFKYRVHIEYFGWTNWTEADGIATLGSVGQGLSIQAIEIKEI